MASTLVTVLGNFIFPYVKSPFIYLCCFGSNAQNLNRISKKLEDARNGLQRQVDNAKNNAKEILPEVETWLEDANQILEENDGIQNEINNMPNGCFSVVPRFSLSKKVVETAERMEELWASHEFPVISTDPPPPAARLPTDPRESTLEFESRKLVEKEIMKILERNEVNMVGICGMGGVGKTTMAKTIRKRAKEEELFDETVMVVVSQKVDVWKIQKEMAEFLDMELKQDNSSIRAQKLQERLEGGNRTLIIIDDVWANLDLRELGIRCESGFKKCTVVLTSRDEHVFNAMDVKSVHKIGILPATEAWPLFLEKAGTSCAADPNLLSIAKKIVKECHGLPVALVNVAAALKGKKDESTWKDALRQLESSNPKGLPDMLEKVYKPIKLSYDFLEGEDAKSIFLLCCLFPEDYNIPIEDLTLCAMGLHIFERNITNLEQARNRTCSLIGMLKSRSLLMEGGYKEHVKMHDVVRDVSLFIASEEKRISCNECTWISSFLGERSELFVGSIFPKLHLLLIDNSADEEVQIDGKLLEGMRELNVLFMRYATLTSLARATQSLKNLRTLLLDSCAYSETISVIGELENLEILICRDIDSIEELPLEIGRLNRLRLLEISSCRQLKKIAPGVISSLKELEELKIVGSFNKWEAGHKEGEGLSNLELAEALQSVRSLILQECSTAKKLVNITTSSVDEYGTSTTVFPLLEVLVLAKLDKLEEICDIGQSRSHHRVKFPKLKTLSLYILPNLTTFGKGIQSIEFPLLTELRIQYCPNMKSFVSTTCSIVCGNYHNNSGGINDDHNDEDSLHLSYNPEKVVFGNLKKLYICGYNNLSVLWCPQTPPNLFIQLEKLEIEYCGNIRSLFSSSITRNLVNLKNLRIQDCEEMVKVIGDDEEKELCQSAIPLFPRLQELRLINLPELEMFCNWRCALVLPSLNEVFIDDCPKMERFSSGSITTPNLEELMVSMFSTTCNNEGQGLNDAVQQTFLKEKEMEEERKKRFEELENEMQKIRKKVSEQEEDNQSEEEEEEEIKKRLNEFINMEQIIVEKFYELHLGSGKDGVEREEIFCEWNNELDKIREMLEEERRQTWWRMRRKERRD